jgi:hypothetical protein
LAWFPSFDSGVAGERTFTPRLYALERLTDVEHLRLAGARKIFVFAGQGWRIDNWRHQLFGVAASTVSSCVSRPRGKLEYHSKLIS